MSDKEFDVIVVGDVCADLVLSGDVTPAFGQKEKLIDSARLTLGSSAGIFACGASRLGLRTAILGVVGDDEFGAFMRRGLAEHGVNSDRIVVDPQLKTGLTVILSRGEDRAMLTYSGSISALRFDHLDLSFLPRARHLHLACYFLLDSLRADVSKLFHRARMLGLTTSLDTNYDPSERWDSGLGDALARTDVFFPNEIEARAIAGETDPRVALAHLARMVPTVALKLGALGSMAQHGAEIVSVPALPISVVDTTGAGDTFDAGFLRGWLARWPLDRCLRLAGACGSLSTRSAGGTVSQPTFTEAVAAAGL